MIYQASEEFVALLELAGIRQSELARRINTPRSAVSHVAARRRNIGGAAAARIAAVYSEAASISQEEALARLFVPVAEKKYQVSDRKRGSRGQFVREDAEPPEAAPPDGDAAPA